MQAALAWRIVSVAAAESGSVSLAAGDRRRVLQRQWRGAWRKRRRNIEAADIDISAGNWRRNTWRGESNGGVAGELIVAHSNDGGEGRNGGAWRGGSVALSAYLGESLALQRIVSWLLSSGHTSIHQLKKHQLAAAAAKMAALALRKLNRSHASKIMAKAAASRGWQPAAGGEISAAVAFIRLAGERNEAYLA
jgi:hypothetical protein